MVKATVEIVEYIPPIIKVAKVNTMGGIFIQRPCKKVSTHVGTSPSLRVNHTLHSTKPKHRAVNHQYANYAHCHQQFKHEYTATKLINSIPALLVGEVEDSPWYANSGNQVQMETILVKSLTLYLFVNQREYQSGLVIQH